MTRKWQVEYTDEFEMWWLTLADGMQDDIDRVVMLLGGDKTGNSRWYDENVPKAERLFAEHLEELGKEHRL